MRHEQRAFLIAAGGGGAARSNLADQADGAGGALDLDRHLTATLRDLFGRLEIIHGRKGDETRGLEPSRLAIPTEVALELPDRLIHHHEHHAVLGPVTAKVCVLARALRNTRFVKSTVPDPQQNQALRPSFPRAPGSEVSRDTTVIRSTV